ncbi:unnamed protein product [Ceratitis capitata]|uniref:(Mediterranean fruit fly) hypothetical protein n=1 Tax=Ceratitis capitata TaxID=7213 RepID=A0A811V150_CERCA|nr:unnamed protein product [Ceratitis capitata]
MRLGGVDAALETKPTQLNLQLQQPKLYATTATTTGGTTKSTPPFEYSPSPHSLPRCAAPTNSTQYYPMWQQVECVLPHFELSACDEGAPTGREICGIPTIEAAVAATTSNKSETVKIHYFVTIETWMKAQRCSSSSNGISVTVTVTVTLPKVRQNGRP